MVRSFDQFTLLFSSLSAKIALYQATCEQARLVNPNYKTIGADSDPACIGAKEIDSFVKMPPIQEFNQENLLHFCKENNIQFVIPTRDGELLFWAVHQEFLFNHQIGVMISSQSAISLCEDKYSFFKYFEKGPIPSIRTSFSLDALPSSCERFVVKERMGSASRSIGLNLNSEEVDFHLKSINEPIFQPQINGRELSAETWIDRNGMCHGVVLRWRILIINGESHESEIFSNTEWAEKLIQTFSMISGLQGHVLAQVIVDEEGCLHLVEINPRLGGASPLSLKAGLDSIKWSLQEFMGESDQIPKSPILKNKLRLSKKNQVVKFQ